MIIFAAFLILFALAGIFLFQGGILTGVLELVLAVGIILIRLLTKDKLSEKIRGLLYGVCTLGFILCAVFSGVRSTDENAAFYDKAVAKAEANLNKGQAVAALETLEEAEKNFGLTDQIVELRTEALLADGQYQEALNALSRHSDQESEICYLLRAEVKDAEAEVVPEGDREMYFRQELQICAEGAGEHPENFELNYKAGCLCLTLGEYNRAQYYLSQALTYDTHEDDPYAAYMLALAYYETGMDNYAYAMMTIAEERGILKSEEFGDHEIFTWYEAAKQVMQEEEG
jgi:tetratricopeptide (TPR) repeat protein